MLASPKFRTTIPGNVTFNSDNAHAWLTVIPDDTTDDSLKQYAPNKTKLVVTREPKVTKTQDGKWRIEFPDSPPPTEAEKILGPSPSAEFIKAFEFGVRYGLIAKMDKPDEDNIDVLTKQAVQLYAMVERGGWKSVIKDELP